MWLLMLFTSSRQHFATEMWQGERKQTKMKITFFGTIWHSRSDYGGKEVLR